MSQDDGTKRTFETGATRDTAEGKIDYEGFLSPLVLERFGKYMHAHRVQSDGTLRASDNWQVGIPLPIYMSSAWRHFMDWWDYHRHIRPMGWHPKDESVLEDAICGLLFNAMGYLHEVLKARRNSAGE